MYAIALGHLSGRTLTIRDLPVDGTVIVEMLGHHAPLDVAASEGTTSKSPCPAEPIDTPAWRCESGS